MRLSTTTRGDNLWIGGARSYPPGPASGPVNVRIREGVIEAVGPEVLPEGLPQVDAGGLTAIPGLVDVHVHFRDPGLEHIEGWDKGSLGALHGGVTSVVEVQNNPPLSTSRRALEERLAHVAKRSRVDYGCLANLVEASLPELAAMAPLTPAYKCFLGGSTGLGGVLDDDLLARLFEGAARAGRMVVAHCEDEAILQRDVLRVGFALADGGAECHAEDTIADLREAQLARLGEATFAPNHLVK